MAMLFLERLQRNCQQYGDKTALELVGDGDASLVCSYAQLEGNVLRTMAYLRAKGVTEGDRVALHLPKCLPFIYLHLATMRLGAISLPLNSAYPAHELCYYLEDAAAKLLFAGEEARPGLDAHPGGLPSVEEVVYVGSEWEIERLEIGDWEIAQSSISNLQSPSATCLIIYTSGTTGRPKGAELTHGNLTANLDALHEAWGWHADDVLLHVLPIFHVHGLIVALHGALHAGATTVVLPRFDPERTLRLLCNRPCTLLMGVPAIHRRLVNVPDAAAHDLRHLRLITSGSDRLPDDLFDQYRRVFGHTLLERYGMSETGMLLSNPLDGERRVGSVGRPLPGVEARIVHPETGQPVSDGEIGAVQVRGPNVFKGYWRRPEQTAEAFTADGWFRTGDLGLRGPDGYFTLKGRSRDLIISGGYNVYPSEVELVLAQHPAVQAAAVIGCPDDEWGERVVAVVVTRPGAEPPADEIVTHCRTYLAGYKVPRRVVFVENLPRNSLGKVQRGKLQQAFCAP